MCCKVVRGKALPELCDPDYLKPVFRNSNVKVAIVNL